MWVKTVLKRQFYLLKQISVWLQKYFTEIVCKKKVLMDFQVLFTTCVLCLRLGIDIENIGFGNGGIMTEVKLVRDDLTTEYIVDYG